MRTLALAALLAGSVLAPVEALDWRVQHAVQDARRPEFERVMRAATDIGKPVVVAGALIAIGLLDRAQGLATLRAAALALAPTNLAVEGLKRATDRTRPDGTHKRSNASFPSSHAANAFALAWVVARRWPRATWGLFVSAALVAVSRIYLNRHFISDVMVGAALGMLFGWLATRRWGGRSAGARSAAPPRAPAV